jgi:hypothetical protein
MIECLALRHAVGDVEQHDVAQFLVGREMSKGSADVTGADQRNLIPSHASSSA